MKIGVDLGGTNLRAATVSDDGQLLCVRTVPTLAQQGAASVMQRMAELILSLPSQAEASAIGVGAPCAVSRDGNTLKLASNLPGMDGFPLRNELEKQLCRPVHLMNDANAACLGEALFGAGRGAYSVLYLTLSTGIGGGYCENGRLLTGAHGFATELGSLCVDALRPAVGDLPCGAVEAEVSGTALARRYGARHAGEVLEAAGAGDKRAQAIVDDFVYCLTIALSNLACVLDPECIVLGGGLLKSKALFWDALLSSYRSFAQETYKNIPIRAALLPEPGLVGAAMGM